MKFWQFPYSIRIRPETQDIPVTPVRNINRVDVGENNRDHERYSAIDKKIYRRYEKHIDFLITYKQYTFKSNVLHTYSPFCNVISIFIGNACVQ